MNIPSPDIRPSNELSLNQILGRPEGWWLYWGTGVVLFTLLGLVVAGSFISYPVVLEADAALSAAQPPIAVPAPRDAAVHAILKYDGDTVRAGDRLLLLEDTAKPSEVLRLHAQLDTFPLTDRKTRRAARLTALTEPGNLAPSLAAFEKALSRVLELEDRSMQSVWLLNLQQRESTLLQLVATVEDQLVIRSEQTRLYRDMAERDSLLHANGAGSRTEYEQSRQLYLGAHGSAGTLLTRIEEARLALAGLEAERLERLRADTEQLGLAESDLREKYRILVGAVDAWLDRNTVVAPVDGRLEWARHLYPQLAVSASNTLFRVIPTGPAPPCFAWATLPHDRIGEIHPGLPVRLRLDAYPYERYGEWKGTVETVARYPDEDGYLVRFSLSENQQAGGRPPLFPAMKGKVRILTDRSSLLEQLFLAGNAFAGNLYWAD